MMEVPISYSRKVETGTFNWKKIKDISPLIGIKEIFIQNPQAGDCQEGQKRKGKTRTSNS